MHSFLGMHRLLVSFLILLLAESTLAMSCGDLIDSNNKWPTVFHFTGAVLGPVISRSLQGDVSRQANVALVSRVEIGGASPKGVHESLETIQVAESVFNDGFLPTQFDLSQFRFQTELAEGLSAIHEGYGVRLSEEEKALIKYSDSKTLEKLQVMERTGYFIGRAHDPLNYTRTVVSLLRVVDGNKRFNEQDEYRLPAEKAFASKDVDTDVFDDLREDGWELFELGKYFVARSLKPGMRKEARNQIFEWLIRNYLEPAVASGTKRMFVIDVGSKVHEDAYRLMFKAKSLDRRSFSPPLPETDAIMLVDAETLMIQLKAIIAGQ